MEVGVYWAICGTPLIHSLPKSRVSCLQEGYSRVDDDDDDDDDDEDNDDAKNRTEFAIKVVQKH